MQVVFYSEDSPKGQVAEWPEVPRVGDMIEHSHAGGRTMMKVERVIWHAETDSSFHSVPVELTYG